MPEANNFKIELLSNLLNKESIERLEWPILMKQVSLFASTDMGRKAIIEFEIPKKKDYSEKLLKETIEINQLEFEEKQNIDFSDVFDIQDNIGICFKGGVLNTRELLEIAKTISSARRLKKIIFNNSLRPILSLILDKLVDHNSLEKILKTGIENNGRISDSACEKLSKLRFKLNSLKNERRQILDKYIQKNSNYIQDSIIGDRFGRPVLAIKVSLINKVKGIIHDSSSSGNTIFLEPECIVSKGNEIVSINAKIASEEFKLLKNWSKIVAQNKDGLILTSNILLKIENALTRSRYSSWIKGNPPKFDNNSNISIKGFTHPLLIWESKKNLARKPIPIDFYINRTTKVVAITGPNTGGKTAALKGLGIALLMAKAGFFIPSKTIAQVPFYSNIYVDIGDEQSLEQNLSTFSGHISRIKKILDCLILRNGLNIVLLDEIGSGTDPEEGTALAIALLNEFSNKSDLTMVTTHYGDIKALKYKDDRFENVSVSFDEDSLKPTYTLNWGIPGRSNALSISSKIGLNQKIIDNASNYLKPKEVENINKIIKGLEEQRQRQQNAAEDAAALIARTEILYEDLNRNYEYQKRKAKEFQIKERDKLTKLIKEAKSEVVKLIEKLRNNDADGEDSRKIGIRLKEIELQFSSEDEKEPQKLWKPKVGEFIIIKSLGSKGKIISIDDEGLTYKVNCGSFNSLLPISDIEGINGEQPDIPKLKIEVKSVTSDFNYSTVRTSKNTIDVRGLRVHEAEIIIQEKIRRYHGPIWIIHGIGTGKLKKGLKIWLSKLDYVEKIEDASPSEGGPGCSIAWIK